MKEQKEYYVIFTARDVKYQDKPEATDNFTRPVLYVYSELGHKFYTQISRNAGKITPRQKAEHMAQLAHDHNIPQTSLQFYRKNDKSKKSYNPIVDNLGNVQLSLDLIPF
jgi:hypothetical protein